MFDRHGFYAIVLWQCLALPLWAQQPPAEPKNDGDKRKSEVSTATESVLDYYHRLLSEQLEINVKRIDNFFADQQYYELETDSFIRMRLSNRFDDNTDKVGFVADMQMRTDFPGTRHRFDFLFESESDDVALPGETKAVDTVGQAVENKKYYAGVRRVIKQRQYDRLTADAGIRLQEPIDPFVRLQYKRVTSGPVWHNVYRQSLFYYRTTNLGEESRMELNRNLAENWLFRTTSKVGWTDNDNYFKMAQNYAIFYTVSDRGVFVHTTGVDGRSHPIFTTGISSSVYYRRRMKGRWLYFETGPQTVWEKESHFAPHRYYWITFEIVFGDRYL